jgi:organic radical activating enzyme
MKGFVSEIFSSLQGEGLYAGEPQLFIRLAGCPWRCRYCDTPGSLAAEGGETLSVEDVLDRVHHLQEVSPHRTVSVTGGEPLVQTEFLKALLTALKHLDRRTHLETSGTHPHLLKQVVEAVDVVAMDVKFPSAIGRSFWTEHREFLLTAGRRAFVKAVLTAETTDAEIQTALDLLASLPEIPPLVLQPVTAIAALDSRLAGRTDGPRVAPPSPENLGRWRSLAQARLPEVRVLPQLHPLWGVP